MVRRPAACHAYVAPRVAETGAEIWRPAVGVSSLTPLVAEPVHVVCRPPTGPCAVAPPALAIARVNRPAAGAAGVVSSHAIAKVRQMLRRAADSAAGVAVQR